MNLIVNYKNGKLQAINQSDVDSKVDSNVISRFGIIDFGDIQHSCIIFEIAKVIRDFMVDFQIMDSLLVGGYFLSGYLKYNNLPDNELALIPGCVLAGLCQYVVLGEQELRLQPDNEYVSCGADLAWAQLQRTTGVTKTEFIDKWNGVLMDDLGRTITGV